MKVKPEVKFAIWAPGFTPFSGGILALHKLCHNINSLGEKAFLISDHKNPNWLGTLGSQNDIDDSTFVVYPEIITGNPFNAKHVVRWILNTPGVIGGDGIYGATDLVYKYANYFTVPNESQVNGELRAFSMELDFWQNLGQERSGSCFLVRKGAYKEQNKHPADAQNVNDYHNNDFLRQVFNQKEIYISYDHACFVSAQAALCGITSVVIPDGVTSKEDWKDKFPYFKYGVAYGLDDIEWAVNTKHLVRDHMIALEEESIELTKNLIRDCRGRL
jgi:hypothetical protein